MICGVHFKPRSISRKIGSSLLELLVALVITAIALNALTKVFSSAARSYKIASRELEEVRLEGRLTNLLADLLDAHSSSPLPNTVQVHAAGGLTFQSGRSVSGIEISEGSNAVSAIKFYLDRSALVSYKDGVYTVCGEGFWSIGKAYIAISNEGWSEIHLNAAQDHGICRSVTITAPNDSIFSAAGISAPNFSQKIVPAEIFSFYLSKAGEVRRLTHVGDAIIESQPMFNKLTSLRFELATEGISLTYQAFGRCESSCGLYSPLRLITRNTFPLLFLR